MLLRVYVQPRDEFDRWIQQQRQPASISDVVSEGRRVFEITACINCHAVAGTVANWRFGPHLTPLISRGKDAARGAPNTPKKIWALDSKAPAHQPWVFIPGGEV